MLRHVRRQLLAFHGHREIHGRRTEPLRRAQAALRQQIADAAPERDRLDGAEHGLTVAEREAETAVVEESLGLRFHRPRDGAAARDRIHSVLVRVGRGLREDLQIADAAHRAEEGERLVLRPAVHGIDVEPGLVHLDHALALDDARVASVALLQDGLGHDAAVDLLRVLERAFVVVARRLAAHLVLDPEHARRPELTEPADAGIRLLQ